MKIVFAGGINENGSQSIDPQECAEGQNFELGLNVNYFKPRKPFAHYATAPAATSVTGILQLVKRDATVTTLVASGTSVYLMSSVPGFTSVGTITTGSKLRDLYWSLGDYLIITDIAKTTVVKKWDGTTFSTLTTGLGTDLYAKYGAVHNGRVWLFNVKTTTDTPHLMVASAFENPTSYDTAARAPQVTAFATGNEAFYMLTPDLLPINGVTVFQNQLIISTQRGRLFKLTGTDANDYAWTPFYQGSSAAGTETMINMGNDVAYMKEGGPIDLLSSTQNYGDVRADDLTRWIPDTVRGLTDAISAYDQVNQKVYWFTNDGSTGTVLTLFKDLLPSGLSPWGVYKTAHTSSFITSAVKYMYIPGTTTYRVFWGDSVGKVHYFEGTTAGDGDTLNAIVTSRKTALKEGNVLTNILMGNVQYRRLAEVELNIAVNFAEEYNTSTASITLKGPTTSQTSGVFGGTAYFGGAFYFSQAFVAASQPSVRAFSNVGFGRAFTVETSITSTSTFQIDFVELEIDR